MTVKVVSIDEKGKIGLSMKALMPPAEQKNEHGGEGRKFEGRKFEGRKPGEHHGDRKPGERRFSGERKFEGRPGGAGRPQGPMSFEDKLSRFLKESDDRLLDLKRNTESKRGGRGARRGD